MFTVTLVTYYGEVVCDKFKTLEEAREFAARIKNICVDCEITDGDKQYEVVKPTLN